MIIVPLDDIKKLIEERQQFNKLDLSNIIFVDKDNNPIVIDPKLIEEFKDTGLNNTDFIDMELYKEENHQSIIHENQADKKE